ncbi:UNVERIFIED_CONTAM: hypothetical protein FKN15_054922 [Acipenser sinensis]
MNHHLKVAVPLWPSMGNTPEVKKLLKKAASKPKPYLYKGDHAFPGINGGDPPVVILYDELGTNTFNNFHKVLSEKAENGEIVYVLHHFVACCRERAAARQYSPVSHGSDTERIGFVFVDENCDGNKDIGVALFRALNYIVEEYDFALAFSSMVSGQLTDETDVVEYLMDQPNVVPPINTRILSLRRSYLDRTSKPERSSYAQPTCIRVVSNPAAKPTEENTVTARAIMAAVLTQKQKEAFHFVMKLIKEESVQALAQGTKMKDLVIQGMDSDGFEKKHNTLAVDFIHTQQLFCQDVVKQLPGQVVVVINGRLTFIEFDRLFCIRTFLHSYWASDLVMKVDALLTSAPKGETRRDVRFIKDELSFYRNVLEPDVTFLANNTLSPGPVAKFLEMPESPLLTLNMITPESWLVEAVQSSHDLDNIHLQEIDGIVKAEYELEYLLLEGHCFDVTTGQPTCGLQFTLGVKIAPIIQGTIVVKWSSRRSDLPNNMIHQVASKSLPQEWLWCETWCGDKSKKTPKTIDLVCCIEWR